MHAHSVPPKKSSLSTGLQTLLLTLALSGCASAPSLVDRHFAARQALASIDAALEQQEVAFRSIQKRLLVRCKVRRRCRLQEGGACTRHGWPGVSSATERVLMRRPVF